MPHFVLASLQYLPLYHSFWLWSLTCAGSLLAFLVAVAGGIPISISDIRKIIEEDESDLMPSPKSHRKGGTEEKNRKGRLAEKAMSFSGQSGAGSTAELLHRPRTVPDLLAGRRTSLSPNSVQFQPKLTKLLINVTVQRSTGALHVLISPESTVEDLIAAAIRQYVKEGRRPVLPSGNAADYGLHYSQFSLESLDRKEKLNNLGSRNFFMCPEVEAAGLETTSSLSGSCSKEASINPATKVGLSWFKFML
ncbi:unnamed protein product [Cuscuta epithymum]|uniref:DUF7054 domain-containing protein n=1 Tax=Cuscuta epithymum TaxID=186058 RepID=A0AAV0EPB1_9ASTE|nr:unnamed protein product [Cuscuta epithymum]